VSSAEFVLFRNSYLTTTSVAAFEPENVTLLKMFPQAFPEVARDVEYVLRLHPVIRVERHLHEQILPKLPRSGSGL
jgi:hypothetical protein